MDKFFLDKDVCSTKEANQDNPSITTNKEEVDKLDPLAPNSSQQQSLSFHVDPLQNQTSLSSHEETDLFKETTCTPGISNIENNSQPKGILRNDKAPPPPPPPHFSEINNLKKINLDKINELDKFRTMVPFRFYGPYPRAQADYLRAVKDPVPGPSCSLPKKKKRSKKPFNVTDFDDDANAYDDVKSITNCLIKNTLNILNVEEPTATGRDRLIELNTQMDEPEPKKEDNIDDIEGGLTSMEIEDVDVDAVIVDLKTEDNSNEENSNLSRENGALETTDQINDNLQLIEQTIIPLPFPVEFKDIVDMPGTTNEEEMSEVAIASREALVDPNSQQSLLEDFEVPHPMEPAPNEANPRIIMIDIRNNPEDVDNQGNDANGFPHWLLQILGAHVISVDENGTSEEPHYFCQGDGLGVHPSVIVEVEDEEDDTTDSSNNTAEFDDVEQGPSTQDVSSLSVDAANAGPSDDATTEREDVAQPQVIVTHSSESLPGISKDLK